jgi:hypothetical protein
MLVKRVGWEGGATCATRQTRHAQGGMGVHNE